MRYLPQTPADVERMLKVIGVRSVDELFTCIPEGLRHGRPLELPEPLCEAELLEELRAIGQRNRFQSRDSGFLAFVGAGLYRHHIPSAVDALSLRGEFATAYTPYQAELAQGTLLSIFEFQTMVAELLGMEIANASMYDGASAAAEGALMARRLTGRSRVLVTDGVHPEYRETCSTYLAGLEAEGHCLGRVPLDAEGKTDPRALAQGLDDTVACVVAQTPNFLGVVEDLTPVAEAAHRAGALLVVVCTEPLALALLKSPAEMGADIAAAEGISLASPPNLGGPGVGLFAASGKQAARAMPGRLVGQTVDRDGRVGYVMTLTTREQHIRREKATSNICTNTALLALRFAIHLSLLGRTGFRQLAKLNLAKASYAREAIGALPGYALRSRAPSFNEFAVRVPGGDAQAVVTRVRERADLVPGVALGRFDRALADTLLVSVTETHRRADLDRLIQALKEHA
ncbi:MAG: aminomethyl-transferring glycine dehydrogenase subunit GcvPA [Deltaproteobacteria bacterium]|nr:aminomethyl-transferring glycine dehydrogenase subunit GcvPA [Deltaproteobacteria bacterium]